MNLRPGHNRVGVDLPGVPLLDGIYDVNVGVVDPLGNTVYAWREQARPRSRSSTTGARAASSSSGAAISQP